MAPTSVARPRHVSPNDTEPPDSSDRKSMSDGSPARIMDARTLADFCEAAGWNSTFFSLPPGWTGSSATSRSTNDFCCV